MHNRNDSSSASAPGMVTGEHLTPASLTGLTAAGLTCRTPIPVPVEMGDYEILEELGRGGMGVVFKARQKSLGRIVALKRMLTAGTSPTILERFRQEAHAAAALDHPGIVPLFDFGEFENQPYFTMAFIEGDSLSGMLAKTGPFSPPQAVRVLCQLADAVAYAHDRGILHRDLKPENVLVDRQGHARLTDFGLARRLNVDHQLTNTGSVVGTPAYMAPEQASGRRDLTPAVDVYSLGAVLHTLLIGQAPFTGDSLFEVLLKVGRDRPRPLREINPSLPEELELICSRCLEKDPNERYESARALVEDLEAWLAANPDGGPASGRHLPVSRSSHVSIPAIVPSAPKRPERRWLLPTATLLTLLAAGAMAGFRYWPRGSPAQTNEVQTQESKPSRWGGLTQALTTDFPVRVSILDAAADADGVLPLKVNRPIRIAVEPAEDAHIGIWSLQADGDVVQLFPNRYDVESLVRANTTKVIPGSSRYQIRVRPAGETEYLRVVASTRRWEPVKGKEVGPFIAFPAEEKNGWLSLQRGLIATRGLAIVPVEPDKPAEKVTPARITEVVLRYLVHP